MSFKTPATILIAAFLGIAAALLYGRLVAMRSAKSATVEIEKVPILVAKRNIAPGEIIKLPKEMFEEKHFVRGEEPREAIHNFADLQGRLLKRTLRAGDFVRDDDFVAEQRWIENGIPEGFRTISIPIDSDSISGSMARWIGSRVDLIHSKPPYDSRRIFLENVKLLDIDLNLKRKDDGDLQAAPTVKLAVTPEDALKIHLGLESGKLSIERRILR